jgi:cytochrome c556
VQAADRVPDPLSSVAPYLTDLEHLCNKSHINRKNGKFCKKAEHVECFHNPSKEAAMKMRFCGIGLAVLVVATGTFAQDAGPFAMQIKARQGIMNYRAVNIGTLAGMAKGEVPYDAAAAKVAADALLTSAKIDMSMLWPEGSDNAAHAGTNALPAGWSDYKGVVAAEAALLTATEAMAAATDLAGLQGAMGPLGGACGGCHKTYRAAN